MSELTYHINKKESEAQKALVLNIGAASHPLTAAQLKKMALAKEDSLVVPFLIQEEVKYQKRQGKNIHESTGDFNTVHISYSQTLPALKLLAATGKLHFNQRQIVCDFYGKNELYYCAAEENGKLKISARLKTSTQDFDVKECDFICAGPPHWFIKGISLKLITTEAAWSDIKKALADGLTQEDLVEEPDNPLAPKIIYTGNAQAQLKHLQDPLPLLILKDRTGAFADLWMDYGNGQSIALQDLSKTTFARNPAAEKGWEKDLLETGYIKKMVSTSHYYCPMDKIAKSLGFLLELGWQVKDWKGSRIVHGGKADMAMESISDTIIVKGKMKFENYEANLAEVAGAFNRKERFIQLAPGVAGLLPDRWDEAGLSGLMEEGEIAGDKIKVNKSRIGTLSDLFEKNPQIHIDASLSGLRDRLQSFKGINEALPGESFKGELRAYQQEGVNWLEFLYSYGFHGILADDMGLGKTVQVLAFLSRMEIYHPILIIMPTSLIFNWQREIKRFLPDFPVIAHHGPDRNPSPDSLQKSGIILTSYTTLRLDLDLFSTLQYQCIILDEAQVIKNAHTQTAQAVCQLRSRFRLSLTGTPLENHLNELWSHFHFLMPDLFGEEKEFEAELLAGSADSRFIKRIQKKIRPFILRRKKEEVAKDLPEKIEQVVWMEMSPPQRAIYDEFLSGVRGNLLKKVETDGISRHRMEVLEAILRLRQICCHPLLISGHLDEHQTLSSTKLDTLLQDLETVIEEGRKVLIYSQFTSMLQLIKKELKERKWGFAYLDGSTTDREKVVTQFQEDSSIQLFLISLKAGGIGLNLTAADYVFLYDPWWNEAAENQAINRAHRIGRKETVIAKRYVMAESIEEKMMTLKAHKRNLIEEIFEDDLGNSCLTEQDLSFLLS